MKKLHLILMSMVFCSLIPTSFAETSFTDTCPKPEMVKWNPDTKSWGATISAGGNGTTQVWTQVVPTNGTATAPEDHQTLRFMAIAANTNTFSGGSNEIADGPFQNILCGYSDKSEAQLKKGDIQIILQPPAGMYAAVTPEHSWFAMAEAIKNRDINKSQADSIGRNSLCNAKVVEQCSFKVSATPVAATTPVTATTAAITTPTAATAPAATPATATPVK